MSTIPPSGGPTPPAPMMIQVVPEAPPVPPRRRSFFGRFLLVFLLLALVGSLGLNLLLSATVGLTLAGSSESERLQEKFVSHNADAKDKVAIITIEGIIQEAEDGFVKRQIDHVMKDKNVKAVVLRVDSPGGTIGGSDYLYHHLVALRERENGKLPIVVSMGGIAASGGYYVSMAVGHTRDTIFAEPTTFTGSIGVVMPHYDISGLLKKYDVVDDSVASHRLKTMGSMTKPMTPEEQKIFQKLIDASFDRFKEIVCKGRACFRKDGADLKRLATGQVFDAAEAKKEKLVDKLGFLEDAVDRAIVLAGLDEKEVKVVKYQPELSLRSLLMGTQSRSAPAIDPKALLELATPRAYYLATWLPGMASKGTEE